jgi:hypothetical protein
LGKIKGGCGGACEGGTNGKGARVSEGVEYGVAWLAAISHSSSIVPLVKKDSLRVPGLEADEITNSLLRNFERVLNGSSGYQIR